MPDELQVGRLEALRRMPDAVGKEGGSVDEHILGIADDDHHRDRAVSRQPLVEQPLSREQLLLLAFPFEQ